MSNPDSQDGYVELFWDCPECGQQAISAIDGGMEHDGFTCPHCAYNRKRNDALYDRPESRPITDPDLIERIESGKIDWECKYCGSLNPQTGIGEQTMACRVCHQFQQDEISPNAPLLDQTGEKVQQRTEAIRDRLEVVPENLLRHAAPANDNRPSLSMPELPSFDWQSLPWRKIAWGLGIAGVGSLVFLGGWWLFAPRPLEVKVQSLPWEVTVELQELHPIQREGWDETVPLNARILSSETRQRGTREEQQGTKTIQVSEQYQSGTKTETYTVQEQYQSGTKTESYTDSERYQSGTEDDCKTTTTGTGAGRKSCTTIPVYSTRSVSKTRQVPQYSTRPVTRERKIAVYDTRLVPKVIPNMVTLPVYDTWETYIVQEWEYLNTLRNQGVDDQPRIAPRVTLGNGFYPQRALAPQEFCKVVGFYKEGDQQKTGAWGLPCTQFDLINTGDTVKMEVNRVGGATLALPQ